MRSCEEERSNLKARDKYLFLSLFLHLFGREPMERLFDSYLRTETSDEEVYEERQLDIANRGQGVVRWREESMHRPRSGALG